MSYLEPPPMPAAVIVVKDVGGLVRDYQDRTELYRSQNREVRLHECRSACTLALSLPNVCVYPNSILKFHQAYNEITKQTDLGVTDQLWSSYPPSVRERLGTLTRQYKVLKGSELIALGVRNCNAPQQAPEIMIAKAKPAPVPPQGQDFLAGVETTVASWFGSGAPPQARTQVASRPEPARTAPAPTPASPPSAEAPVPPTLETNVDAPLPPVRPPMIGSAAPLPVPAPSSLPPFFRPIPGSAPILEARFVPLAVARRKLASAGW